MQKLQIGYRNSLVNSKQKCGRPKQFKRFFGEKKKKSKTFVFPMGISTQ